ncbi:MAG TPA: hypothetical protein VFU47_08740, partial [Armatimonadota bacterium]|nr:hypothetical protein [Armatimonadota bacterium]
MPLRFAAPLLLALAGLALAAPAARPAPRASRPLALHPDNPHYFRFRGRPTVLVTSGEHYGAVLNPDFDYRPYLDELHRRGFNLTRTFSGVYAEQPGTFNIQHNTLAPAAGRLLAPWARSETPGFAGGGNKFDLTKRDPAYFRRLRDFVSEAGKRGIVVELVLFCPYYEDSQWAISPLNARNNVNGVGEVPRTEALTLKHPEVVRFQEQMVRDLLHELREADNCYFEICNEPYFGGVTLEWQRQIARVIAGEEAALPAERRHLIAQNIANGAAKVTDPFPEVSLFNFHYANPPDAVPQNWDLNRAIGFDETGFKGTGDTRYR